MITVGITTVAGELHGYGHIVRCLELARILEDRGCRVCFRGNVEVRARAAVRGFAMSPNHEIERDVWIVDLPGGISLGTASRLVPLSKVLVSLGGGRGRHFCDLVFYQGVTWEPYSISWAGWDGEWHEGPKWLILREEIQRYRYAWDDKVPWRVAICGGGSDPEDVTSEVVNAIWYLKIGMMAIIGPGNERDYTKILPDHSIAKNPVDIFRLLATAQGAVVSYGMTAFECLAMGVPVVALSITDDQARSADMVAERSDGALVHLGRSGTVDRDVIGQAVDDMVDNTAARSRAGLQYIDGWGGLRVATRILKELEDRHGLR